MGQVILQSVDNSHTNGLVNANITSGHAQTVLQSLKENMQNSFQI